MRQIREYDTADGPRFRVRYRLGGQETSETFRRRADAEVFRDILGDGRGDRVQQALAWLRGQQAGDMGAPTFAAWFGGYVDQLTGVTERTRGDYRSLHRRYLTSLDRLPLTAITRTHVTGIVNTMDRAGRSPKTIKQAVHLLSTCLQHAVEDGHVAANPCRRVRLPEATLDRVDARFLTHEEFSALARAIPAHYRPLVVFLVGTGMRWSEATALQARHIDLAAGTVRVEQAWKRVPGGFEIGTPKTRRSRRTVNAATMALVAVKPLLGKQRDLVFTTPSGGPVRHAMFHKLWRAACHAAELDPPPRIHDLRHTHASWLISDGIQLEAVQDQLGHESILTTRGVYGGLLPALGVAVGRAASAALDRALPDGLDSALALDAAGQADQVGDPDGVAANDTEGGDDSSGY